MSATSRVMYRSTFTLWRVLNDGDEYGEATYSEPIFVKCQFLMGGSTRYTDQRGREFQPKSTIWTEMRDTNGDVIDSPRYDDLIAIGEIHSSSPQDAFPVRTVEQFDVSLFDDIPDFKIMTE